MHENREISCTSCSKEQDRSAKAINRTADMNVQEKSDCAVVPVNQSNKEAQASAEAEEGRAQTKENIVQSHKPPTQSGKGLSQGLHGVHLRGRLQRLLLRISAWSQPASGIRRPDGGHPAKASELGTRCGYSWLLRCARVSPALSAGEIPAPERGRAAPPGIESWAHEGNNMS